jgi:regulator of nucleoside diphosphate kinase
VVTLHALVHVLDLQSGERQEVVLVSPAEADVKERRISVLAPLGTALLGYREGDEVEWLMPGGLRRLRIERVVQASDVSNVASAAPTRIVAGAH